MSTSSAPLSLVLLLLSCSSNEGSREMESKPPEPADARPTPVEYRQLRIDVRFEIRDAEPGGEILASRAGSVEVALPYFTARPRQKALVPVELEGGLRVCLAIDAYYKGDPVDSLGVVATNRWELRGAHSSFGSSTFGLPTTGEEQPGDSVIVDWKPEVRGTIFMSARPGTSSTPPLAFVPRDAKDTCVENLRPRVIASLKDL